jgi:hypothetical protein
VKDFRRKELVMILVAKVRTDTLGLLLFTLSIIISLLYGPSSPSVSGISNKLSSKSGLCVDFDDKESVADSGISGKYNDRTTLGALRWAEEKSKHQEHKYVGLRST